MRVGVIFIALLMGCGQTPPPGESSNEVEEGSGTGSDGSSDADTRGPDVGDFPPHQQSCHPFEGPECPEGEKCSPYDDDEDGEWDSWRCFPSPQSKTEHELCLQPIDGPLRGDDCEAGLLCSDPSSTESEDGWCAALCDADHPCPDGSNCQPSAEGLFSWCRPTCNPNDDPSTCPIPELACSFGLEAEFVCNQRITTEGQQGEACTLPTECAYGLTCLSGAVVGPEVCGAHAACCTQMCDTGTPDCPTEAPNCMLVFPNGAEPGFETLGYCGI